MKLKSTKYKQLLLVLIIIQISIILRCYRRFLSKIASAFWKCWSSNVKILFIFFKPVCTEWCIRICTGKWFPSIFFFETHSKRVQNARQCWNLTSLFNEEFRIFSKKWQIIYMEFTELYFCKDEILLCSS